ncbi:hypothetical protein HN283_13690 [Acinetobacter baumannii]|uniref:hypothetical protein n=1 Tax=Acinetobacter baumannii TaxID=470 RepID=UPI001897A2F0|nr:hypothetical protein [Acinetobacter baumannii]MBF6813575.1 hypothetical protein [Acinetobacter baumannii]MBF6914127.1 hypothetical protein [Acinetobacter baumannii]MBF6974616.1 hypothetical protein [Acinetobacter baumannii]
MLVWRVDDVEAVCRRCERLLPSQFEQVMLRLKKKVFEQPALGHLYSIFINIP